jgi:hypothetical protein
MRLSDANVLRVVRRTLMERAAAIFISEVDHINHNGTLSGLAAKFQEAWLKRMRLRRNRRNPAHWKQPVSQPQRSVKLRADTVPLSAA